MKKFIAVAFAMLALNIAGGPLFAQGKWGADSAECLLYVSYYRDYMKQKSYEDATRNWRKAYKLCPASASYNLLVDGGTLVKKLINKNKSNSVYRAALVDTLMTLYDQRAEFFPKYIVNSLNNKGADLHNYVKDDSKKLHEGFNGIINTLEEKTRPTIFLYDFHALVELYQVGDATTEEVLNAYSRYMDYLEKVEPKTDTEKDQIASVKSDLASLFAQSKVASCDQLIEIFTPRLEAEPQNVSLASNIVKTMNMTDDCVGNTLYLNAVTVMHENQPSSASAYALYKLNANQDNVDLAIKYLEEAINFEDSDEAQDAEYKYQLAQYCFKNGMNAKAYECTIDVAKSSPELAGKAYFLAGTIWGQVRCGGNEITSRANYWVAVDFFAKAKAADESLAEEANRYISRFSAFYPSAADAFMYGIEKGQSYTASCGGMTATTTAKLQ